MVEQTSNGEESKKERRRICSTGTHEKPLSRYYFERSTVRIPPRSAKHADKFNTRNTQPRRSFVVKPLCVFIVLEDKVIPCSLLPLCITTQHTHIHTDTHTHTYTRDTSIDVATRKPHAPPSTRFSTLESVLLRNQHPLVSFLQQISQFPSA